MGTSMFNRWSVVAASMLLAALPSLCAVAAEPALDVAIPKDVQVSTLFQPGEVKPGALPVNAAFDVDPDGLPSIADKTSLKLLGSSQQLLTLGVLAIDDFAWMRDDRLLLVTQNHLASLSPKGLVLSLALPGAGMRVRPAGENTAYLFGGSTEPENHDVYLFARDATVTKLASMPAPVTAVAGDGITSYIATDKTILRIALNQPVRALLQTRDPIVSLEIAPREGLFYATTSSVGYIGRDSNAYEFIRGEGGLLRIRGSMLFILMSNGQLLRFGPVGAFALSQK
jgi:hypothetical protein